VYVERRIDQLRAEGVTFVLNADVGRTVDAADLRAEQVQTGRPFARLVYAGGRPSGGRMGGIAGVGRRRGPDHSAGTASTAAATA
jgi:hypothetical protein